MSESKQNDGCCATCRHWEPRVWPLGYCPIVRHTTDRSHGTQCTAHEPKAAGKPDAALLDRIAQRIEARLDSYDDYPETAYGKRLGLIEALEILKEARKEATGSAPPQEPAKPGPFAALPLRVDELGRVVDATGAQVLVCSEDGDCTLRFNEQAVDADGSFICPSCGRLGLRMVEARPGQCGLPEGSAGENQKGHNHE